MSDDADPPSLNQRGFLTQPDIEYLLGERDLTEGSEYNTRRRISNRAVAGILDFIFLDEQRAVDRAKVFNNIPEPRTADRSHVRLEEDPQPDRVRPGSDDDTPPEEYLTYGIRDAFVYFYCGLHDRFGDAGHEKFEATLETAVKRAHERKMESSLVDVEVSITTDKHGLTADEARELYLEEGEDALKRAEFLALIETYPEVVMEKIYGKSGDDETDD